MALTTASWDLVVKKKFLTTDSFKALDLAVRRYIADRSTLPDLKLKWAAWTKKFTGNKTYKSSDRWTAGCALDDIAALVSAGAGPVGIGSLGTHAVALGGGGLRHVPTNHGIHVGTVQPTGSTVVASGWTYVPFDGSNPGHAWAGAVTGMETMNVSKTAKINEAFRRTKRAVDLARDKLSKLSRNPSSWGGPNTITQSLYVNYFGAFDAARFLHVLDNYSIMALAFNDAPNVIDIRNTASGGKCYAACIRRNLKSELNGSLALLGKVEIFLGQAFLNGGGALNAKYATGTDATVGTLIHEFAHGSFSAVDAPMVNPTRTGWTQVPVTLTPGHNNYGLSPDPWNNQASTDAEDRALAAFAPAVAIRNADNYGQFAVQLLMQEGN